MSDIPLSLEELRKLIDSIDESIVELLNARARAAVQIGEAKALEATKVYDPIRENRVLQHIDLRNEGPLSKGAIEDIYAAIITACREIQLQ